jgi:hypothetical protein
MFPLFALLAFGLSVLMLGSQRNYKALGFSALSIGVERHYKLTEYISPALPDSPLIIHVGSSTEYIMVLPTYPPSRAFGLGPPFDHSTSNNSAFSRSCPAFRRLEPETKDLVLYRHPHASGHEPFDFALFLWLGMLVTSICTLGLGIFWDKSRSVFASFRALDLARLLYGDERLDAKNESYVEEPRPCERCANHWISDTPPLKWIGQYTGLQKEYNAVKAKNCDLRARLRTKRFRTNEMARGNNSLRSDARHHKEIIQILCRKLGELDDCVEDMRQYFKLAVAFEVVEKEEDKLAWEAHMQRFKNMAHIPSLHEMIKQVHEHAAQKHKARMANWRRKVPRHAPEPKTVPNKNGMFP